MSHTKRGAFNDIGIFQTRAGLGPEPSLSTAPVNPAKPQRRIPEFPPRLTMGAFEIGSPAATPALGDGADRLA
ncbi:MAG: hypothetical protein ACR2FO_05450 [Actinomycetota bacterium]